MPAPNPALNRLLKPARQFYAERLAREFNAWQDAALDAARTLADKPAERNLAMQRRDMLQELTQRGARWSGHVAERVRRQAVLEPAVSSEPPEESGAFALTRVVSMDLALVDDDTIQRKILVSRLGQAFLDKGLWEFNDLRARLTTMTGELEPAEDDLFRPQVLAEQVLLAWTDAGLSLPSWQSLEDTLLKVCGAPMEAVWRDMNQWLTQKGVQPEVNLRKQIRRPEARATVAAPLDPADAPSTTSGAQTRFGDSVSGALPSGPAGAGAYAGGGAAGPMGQTGPMPHTGPGTGYRPGAGGYSGQQGQLGHQGQSTSGVMPSGSGAAAGSAGGQGAAAYGGGYGGGQGGGSGGAGYAGTGQEGGASYGAAPPGGVGAGGAAQGGASQAGSQYAGGHYAGGHYAGGPAGQGAAAGAMAEPAGGVPGQEHPGLRPPMSILHGGGIDEETRLLTRPAFGQGPRAEMVLEHFAEVMERHLPGFRDTAQAGRPPSAKLSDAMAQAQQRLVAQAGGPAGDGAVAGGVGDGAAPSPEVLLQELRERQVALKQAASTPAERATVELVALLFQAILTEDRIPAQLRIWFARLQMPVLRVALAEPDFFSAADHPARRLIDRMGACVMGFEGGTEVVGTPLEGEIKRIVQVVEAFPDTGRRVFQTVLNEFEKFLEGYFRDQNERSRAGVSLAQQVEQRETLAIQYTIELRKLLGDVSVHDGVREFLFRVWADVLATAAVRHGATSAEVKAARGTASELLWAATPKTRREDRVEAIHRVPHLLTALRQGMGSVGLPAPAQEEAVATISEALSSAFSARAAAVSDAALEELKQRLEMLEELLPDDGEEVEIDESWVLDSSQHQHEGLEIVADGGSMPGPAMLKWVEELTLGSAFMLDLRGRQMAVRLVWQGMSRQLSLFSAGDGRSVLFQKSRLAAFLQAGLLVPLQDESLTIAATRSALEKIKADPERLLA